MTRSLSNAERTEGNFTCPLPSDIPDIPNMADALLSNLSLYYNGNDVAVLAPAIRFADCSTHTTCTSCIRSESQCSWCPFTFKCIASRVESCEGQKERAVNTSCPNLRPPDTIFNNYLIHTNYMYGENPLIIMAENLDTFSDRFQSNEFDCVIRQGELVLFRAPATLGGGGTQVTCQRRQFDHIFEDGEALVNVTLEVVWTRNNLTIDNPSQAGVTLYSCPRLGTNCAVCVSLEADYNCRSCDLSCVLGEDSQCSTADNIIDDVTECPLATISSVSPASGPLEGGTMVTVVGDNLGTARSDIIEVMIGEVSCDIIDQSYQRGVSFKCVTGSVSEQGQHQISINFTYLDNLVLSRTPNLLFTFENPSLSSVTPLVGPQSGGTMVTITGNNLDIGSDLSITLADVGCYVDITDDDEVTCRSNSSGELDEGVVRVAIDNWEGALNEMYRYVADPTVESITPDLAFAAGGTEFTIKGTNLEIIQEPRLLVHISTNQRRRRRSVVIIESEPCSANRLGTLMTCLAPPTNISSPQQLVTIGLAMDGVTALRRINDAIIHANPTFRPLGDQSFSTGQEIRLTIESEGSEFIFTEEMVSVLVTPCSEEQCVCNRITFLEGNTSFTCVVGSTAGLDRGRQLSVTVHIGNYNQTVGRIELSNPVNIVLIVVLVVVALFLVALAVFVFVVFLFCYTTRKKDSRYNQLMVEMEKLESSVARECKLGFAELQTDLDELTGDISGHRLPYHDLKMYLLASLFPGSKDHPVLHPVQLPVHRQISSQRAIKDFHSLCMDKKVLLVFVRTLEEQRNFTIRDKSLVGSLLMVALHNRLDYATEVLKTLMTDLIHRAISKSNPKLLLRRTESVAEKMLTNWLAFCLHGYIVERAGKPLYLLYRAVKNQLEKGPIDVITGEARYSLSEHKLIRQKMDAEVLSVTVEAGDGVRVPVKVLDCDTISQVKEKLLDAVYKSTSVSKRPSLTSVDLEYVKGPRDYMVLRDEDMSMETDGSWKRLNTLQHYGVVDGATFRLMKRQTHAPPGQSFDYPASLISSHAVRNRALSEAEDGSRVWHLFKQQDMDDPRRSPFMNKKMITEVYLPRMLSTKNILQKFVDDLFSSLFCVSHSPSSPVVYAQFFPLSPGTQAPMGYAPGGSAVPMAVKYLLDFLDDAAEGAQMTERDVVHTWKNNALALRFWVNLMKNPEFLFDINKSHTVDACLSVIAQAFIDGCSFTDVKLTIDSPTSKLLYNKEVQGYKTKVRQYYQNVARLPRIPEDAMQSYLKQLSEQHAQMFKKNGGLVVESALYELLRYGNKYSEQLLVNLRAAGLDSRAQVFQSIVRATM